MGTGHACRTCFAVAAYAATTCLWLAGVKVFPAGGRLTSLERALPGTRGIQLTLTTPAPVTSFVTGLYQNVLEREPEPAGLAGWADFLRANCTDQGFEAIAQGFFD